MVLFFADTGGFSTAPLAPLYFQRRVFSSAVVACKMRPTRAFSLAELLVAMLVLSLLAVVLVGVMPASIFGTRLAQQHVVAAMISREVLETVRKRNFMSMTGGVIPDYEDSDKIVYKTTYALSPVTPALPTDPTTNPPNQPCTKDLEVKVNWTYRNKLREHLSKVTLSVSTNS